uniref:ADP-ribosylation factor-related protein 1 n=1 Tax=Maylandia zebra TaxID=106582 RepID=A0A3P9D7T3_9CICH
MYTLLSGLYKYMFQKDEYCVLILGLDNAGKTTFLEQTKTKFSKNYKGMTLSKITTTVGLNIGTIDVGKARLMFWDLGGQEELQSLWDKYYAESHGVIYVIDSTDEERLSESKDAFEKMISSEALEGVPLLVLANKQDVPVPGLFIHTKHSFITHALVFNTYCTIHFVLSLSYLCVLDIDIVSNRTFLSLNFTQI